MLVQILGWILFGAAILWFVPSYWSSHKKRLHQNYFIAYLLLSDEIRSVQKQAFEDWVRASPATDADALALQAYRAIENVADRLARGNPRDPWSTSSLTGSKALLWQCKRDQP